MDPCSPMKPLSESSRLRSSPAKPTQKGGKMSEEVIIGFVVIGILIIVVLWARIRTMRVPRWKITKSGNAQAQRNRKSRMSQESVSVDGLLSKIEANNRNIKNLQGSDVPELQEEAVRLAQENRNYEGSIRIQARKVTDKDQWMGPNDPRWKDEKENPYHK